MSSSIGHWRDFWILDVAVVVAPLLGNHPTFTQEPNHRKAVETWPSSVMPKNENRLPKEMVKGEQGKPKHI